VSEELTLLDHLRELRDRLVRIALAVAVGFSVAYVFRLELFEILTRPVWNVLRSHGIDHLQVLDVTEAIVMYMKTSFIGGLVLSAPFTLHQVWGFIAPGLYSKERRTVLAILVPSVLFLLLGMAFAYAVMIPFAVDFLVGYALENPALAVQLTVKSTLDFELTFLMIFAVVFELPLVMTFLVALGIGSFRFFLGQWRVAVVVAFVAGAILTPPDVVSQVLLAAPLCLLYALGLGGAWFMERRKAGQQASLGTFLRIGLLVVAVLVPTWIWGVQPLFFPPPKVGAVAVLWEERDPEKRSALNVRYADGATTPFETPVLVDDLQAPERHDAGGVPAALGSDSCPGLCWSEADSTALLQRYLPVLVGQAPYARNARVSCSPDGALDLEFTLDAPDPWIRFALESALKAELSRGVSPAWPQGVSPSVRVVRNSVHVVAPLPYTVCRSRLQTLFGENRP
jgi:sec-independent protein translocase protein TatC